MRPQTFEHIIGNAFHHRPIDAWQSLAGQRDSATFPEFVPFVAFLRPALNKTQAWYVFQALDADEDQLLSEDEFMKGVDPDTEVVDMTLRSFGALAQKDTANITASWLKLAQHRGGSVDFPRFANYSSGLWPPLNKTQAWNVFAKLDLNHDQKLTEREFVILGDSPDG